MGKRGCPKPWNGFRGPFRGLPGTNPHSLGEMRVTFPRSRYFQSYERWERKSPRRGRKEQSDWRTAKPLTERARTYDPDRIRGSIWVGASERSPADQRRAAIKVGGTWPWRADVDLVFPACRRAVLAGWCISDADCVLRVGPSWILGQCV